MRTAENVEILSKKGKGHIILTLPTPLAHKIAKETKQRPSSVPFEPKNWLKRLSKEKVVCEK